MRATFCIALLPVVGLLVACDQDAFRVVPGADGRNTVADATVERDQGQVQDAGADVTPDLRPDLSYDACIAQLEVCNGVDDNCNGQIDEGFDKDNDPRYCKNCLGCKALLSAHVALPGCAGGSCTISSCEPGWVDKNGVASDGCEYKCSATGLEVCDGLDNDCDGDVDEGVTLTQQICKHLGACAGTTATCQGQKGWVCSYPANVELQPCSVDADCGGGNSCTNKRCANVVIIDETRCDGIDGDCDGLADDPWVNSTLPNALGAECNPSAKSCTNDADCAPALGSTCNNKLCTPKNGICKDVGQWACKADATDVYCKQTQAGKAKTAETCNGLDDDCDGTVDNAVTDEQWIAVGGFQIFKYEASRPDGSGSSAGILSTGRACSVSGRLPWSEVTRAEARAACKAAGADLCTAAQWTQACRGTSNTAYPYGNSYDPAKCNGRAYDATKDAVLPTQQPSSCSSTWPAGAILNMSGNLKEWVATSFSGGQPADHQIRGGAFDTVSIPGAGAGMSCDYILPAPPSALRLLTLGFRCCK